ncbi:MAG TPA: cyclopropane-fatty-acyl-phospholipid synthase family protein [Bryobacteraceae bacterium]|jgi:cyclopropane-fatty-acyl-phospholipid synthase
MAIAASGAETQPRQSRGRLFSYAIEFEKGGLVLHGEEHPACTFIVKDEPEWHRLLCSDAYELALAFIHAKFEVEGDLVEAVKIYRSLSATRSRLAPRTIAAYLWHQLRSRVNRGSSATDIRFHYDRSNEFYGTFLDSRMVYSCAYFQTQETSLEKAQLAKLNHICRKLQLLVGDRFLDVGCGWGALVLHAADEYGAFSTGCTLSAEQRAWAVEEATRRHLTPRVEILECDYRELTGKFDKIASVGMFEHVGLRQLRTYFLQIRLLLADGGLFLNHGIVRPECVRTGPETMFLARHVFPGGELLRLTDIVQCAEYVGFEVVDLENLRPHYALTCRAWVSHLTVNREKCLEWVDPGTYRTWLLYLAASAASFESGDTEVHQILFANRGGERPLTRDYLYR